MLIKLKCVKNETPEIEGFTTGKVYKCTEMSGDEEFPYYIEDDEGQYLAVDIDYLGDVQFEIISEKRDFDYSEYNNYISASFKHFNSEEHFEEEAAKDVNMRFECDVNSMYIVEETVVKETSPTTAIYKGKITLTGV